MPRRLAFAAALGKRLAVVETRRARLAGRSGAGFIRTAVLRIAVVVLAAIALQRGAFWLERRLVFPRHAVPAARAPADFRWLQTVAEDGVAVHALELVGGGSAPVVVHFHNNRERAEHNVDLARALREIGLGVVLVEYRGYGVSRPGSPSEDGLYRDAEAVLESLARRGVTRDRIILWGHSLGTGVATEMASRGHGRALVLVAPFTSIPALVSDVVPLLPAATLVVDPFHSLAKCPAIDIPTLVIHGDHDEVVPLWMGEALARGVAGDSELVLVEGGRHSDLFARDGRRLLAAVRRLADALDRRQR